MTSVEKVAIPLTIGAAVVGIWAALRKGGNPAVTVQGGTPLSGAGGQTINTGSLPSVAATPLVEIAPQPFGGFGVFGSRGTGYDNTGGDGLGTSGPGLTGTGGGGGHHQHGRAGASPNGYMQTLANLNPWAYYDFGPAMGTPVYAPAAGSLRGVLPSFGTIPGSTSNMPSQPWVAGVDNSSMFDKHGDCGCGCGGSGKTPCGAPRANNMLPEGSGACVPSLFGSAAAGNEVPVIGWSVEPPPLLLKNPFAAMGPGDWFSTIN